MWFIATEDTDKMIPALITIINALGNGAKRLDQEIDIGNGLKPLVASGYWVGDVMRIDIKLKGR